MKKLVPLFLLLAVICFTGFESLAQCTSCGDGTDGPFNATSNTTLAGGTYNFTTFMIASGVTVTVTGSNPLIINCQGNVDIQGTLSANGGDGTNGVTFVSAGVGGLGVAGGFNGANGGFHASLGALPGFPGSGPGSGGGGLIWGGAGGAGHATPGNPGAAFQGGPQGPAGIVYGDPSLSSPLGGSGGGSGSYGNNCGSGGGGAGGGIILVYSCSSVMIGASGSITSNGGNGGSDGSGNCGGSGGGSGGSLLIETPNIVNDGVLSAAGGTGGTSTTNPFPGSVGGNGGEGYIRLNTNSVSGSGSIVTNHTTSTCGSLPPVPTLGEWGLGIFVLLMLTIGTVAIKRKSLLLA